tara:strand:- start:1421 stop:1576 length:156 start_codon:yes stop_codon:yes gene_type:complete
MNTTQLQQQYTVLSFLAPFVLVERKSDGVRGTLEFWRNDDGVRLYGNFQAE